MHEEAEKCEEIGQFSRLKLGYHSGNELRYQLSHSRSDSIDKLREGEAGLKTLALCPYLSCRCR